MYEDYKLPERSLEPPQPKVVCKCKYCDDEICVGDDIIEFDGDVYHEDCFYDCATSILLDRYGAMHSVAEVADKYDG